MNSRLSTYNLSTLVFFPFTFFLFAFIPDTRKKMVSEKQNADTACSELFSSILGQRLQVREEETDDEQDDAVDNITALRLFSSTVVA